MGQGRHCRNPETGPFGARRVRRNLRRRSDQRVPGVCPSSAWRVADGREALYGAALLAEEVEALALALQAGSVGQRT